MTPALTISSLNLPIAASISVLGIAPASLFLSAFTITMNRIVTLRLISAGFRTSSHPQDERVFAAPTCPAELFRRNCYRPRESRDYERLSPIALLSSHRIPPSHRFRRTFHRGFENR